MCQAGQQQQGVQDMIISLIAKCSFCSSINTVTGSLCASLNGNDNEIQHFSSPGQPENPTGPVIVINDALDAWHAQFRRRAHDFRHCSPEVCMLFQPFRPPLSKKSFPVGRVGKKKASREVGFFFFFFS